MALVPNGWQEFQHAMLWKGDCLQGLKGIKSESVQLVLTSPPYNIGKSYERRIGLEAYIAFQKSVISESFRVLKNGGSICWQLGNHVLPRGEIVPLDLLLYPLFCEYSDLHLRNRIIWSFSHGQHCLNRFSGRYENILWFTKGGDYTFNLDTVRVPQRYPQKKSYKGPNKGKASCHPLGKNPGDVWEFPIVSASHLEKTSHPCQFPIALAETLILALSNKRDIILDPFLGAGTTAAAAVMHGRKAIGCEIYAKYIRLAIDRVALAVAGKLPHRPRTKPISVPIQKVA